MLTESCTGQWELTATLSSTLESMLPNLHSEYQESASWRSYLSKRAMSVKVSLVWLIQTEHPPAQSCLHLL